MRLACRPFALPACLLAVIAAPIPAAWSQAVLDSGGYDTTVQFTGQTPADPTEPGKGIEELLLEKPFRRTELWAESLGTTPVLINSFNGANSTLDPLHDRVCLTVQALDPTTGDPGVSYALGSRIWYDRFFGGFYNFLDVLGDPVSPFTDPEDADCALDPEGVPVFFDECPALARLNFVEARAFYDNDPHVFVPVEVEAHEGRVFDAALTDWPVWGVRHKQYAYQSGQREDGATDIYFAARSDMEGVLEYEIHTGSDPFLDTRVVREYAIADGPTPFHADDSDRQAMECDRIEEFYAPVEQLGLVPDGDLCSITGQLDLIGLSESCKEVPDHDVRVWGGPDGNERLAKVGPWGDPAAEPCDTVNHPSEFLLPNLECGEYQHLQAYSTVGDGRQVLRWPIREDLRPLPPGFGPGLDVADTFVSLPGYLVGEVRLATERAVLDGLEDLDRFDLNARGSVHANSRHELLGLQDWIAPEGAAVSDYEIVVAGLHGVDWAYHPDAVFLGVNSDGRPRSGDTTGIDPSTFVASGVDIWLATTPVLVPMGGPPIVLDLDICFSRVTVDYRSNVEFRYPELDAWGSARGVYSAPGELGYSVHFRSDGLPAQFEDRFVTESKVVLYLPQADDYNPFAFVRTRSGSKTQLPVACGLDIGCGQDIHIAGPLTLNVEAEPCAETSEGVASVEVKVEAFVCDELTAGGEVVEIRWLNLTTGDSEIICSGSCSGEHDFTIEPLAPCLNELRVIAIDDADPPNVSTVDFEVRNDQEPPEVEGGCPDVVESGAYPEGLPWTDNCPEPLVVTYDPPLDGPLPTGEYLVTSTASDGCNEAECTYLLKVTSNQPPDCGAGADIDASCDGVQLRGMASDPDGDELTTTWTSSCPDTVFLPGPDVLDPTVLVADPCDTDCILTLTVRDPSGAECSDELRLRIVDDVPPVLMLPPDLTLECNDDTDPSATGVATATDNCGDVSLAHEDLFEAGCGATGILTRTWTATDDCGNSTSGEQVITIIDETAPVPRAALEPAEPLPPASAHSVCSPPTSRRFYVRCSAEDECGEEPMLEARLLVKQQVSDGLGGCEELITELPVDCDELIEIHLVASPCPARPPRSPASVSWVNSEGIRVVRGEAVVLAVTATDDCGNSATALFDPAAEASTLGDDVLEDGTPCPAIAAPTGGRPREGGRKKEAGARRHEASEPAPRLSYERYARGRRSRE